MNKRIKEKSTGTVRSLVRPLNIEITRCTGGIKLVLVGAVGISEFGENTVAIKCHGTKIEISGEKIKMNALENRALEIYGRVEEIRFGYGKN